MAVVSKAWCRAEWRLDKRWCVVRYEDIFGEEFRRLLEDLRRSMEPAQRMMELFEPQIRAQAELASVLQPQLDEIHRVQDLFTDTEAGRALRRVREVMRGAISPELQHALRDFAAMNATMADALRVRADIEQLFIEAETQAEELGEDDLIEVVAERKHRFLKFWIVVEAAVARANWTNVGLLAAALASLAINLMMLGQSREQADALNDLAEAMLRLSAVLEEIANAEGGP